MPTLYKYLPPDRQSYLIDSYLRFSPPGALNDPFELLPAIPMSVIEEGLSSMRRKLLTPPSAAAGMTREGRRHAERSYLKEARQKIRELPTPQEMKKQFIEKGLANLNSKVGLLSLSRRWNSSLMWSHYTASHTGFCVGFDRGHYFFHDPAKLAQDPFVCAPVEYSTARPTIHFRPLSLTDAVSIVLTKAIDWKYEEEERVLARLADAAKTIEAEPFPVSLFSVPHDAITEIVLGIRVGEGVRRAAKKLSTDLKVPLYQAKISEAGFDVERTIIAA